MKNCKPLWRETNLEVKCCQTDGLGALLEFQCRKGPRRCGAKLISKSKCAKHILLGTLVKLMSKKCKPLWREVRFEVKSVKKNDG